MGTHPIFESDFDCLTDEWDSQAKMSGEQMTCKGTLKGHNGWITQIATTPVFPDMLLSASRDKTIIMWQLTRDETQYGIPKRRLNGHSHFVSDVVISSDGQFCLSGIWLLVTPPDDSSDTPRMSSLSLSQLTIVKLCLLLATVPSSCGTLWVFASTPSKNKVTPNGYLASDSHHLPKTLSLFPLTVPFAPLEAATALPSYGIWDQKKLSHSIHWTLVTKSMLSPSRQTDTGFVLPPAPSSRSGTWNRRSSLKNSSPKLWATRKVHHQFALPSAGRPTDKLCSLVTLII